MNRSSRPRRGAYPALVLSTVLVVLSLAACAQGPERVDSAGVAVEETPPPTTATSAPTTDTTISATETTTTLAPTTATTDTAPFDQDSSTTLAPGPVEVVDVDSLGLSGADRACVIDRLPAETDAGRADVEAVDDAVVQCTRLDEFGELFLEGLRQQFGSALSEQQYACLVDGYSRLTGDEMNAVTTAALGSDSEAATEAGEVLAGLLGGCDVSL